MSGWKKLFSAPVKDTPPQNSPGSNFDFVKPSENISDLPIITNSKLVKANDMRAFGEIFCDGYELTGNFTLDEIAAFIHDNKNSHPREKLFATLDDFDQACYTFGHACGYHLKEDNDEESPWSELTTLKRFLKRKENFEKRLKPTTLDSVKAQRFWCDDTHNFPSLTSKAPEFRERKSYIQIVPVEKSYEALIAFPNGYFSDDYSPFENYRISEYLYNNHEIELFGIGANYMGFTSQAPITGEKLQFISAFITSLYSSEERKDVMKAVSETLSGQTHFYFCYGER